MSSNTLIEWTELSIFPQFLSVTINKTKTSKMLTDLSIFVVMISRKKQLLNGKTDFYNTSANFHL